MLQHVPRLRDSNVHIDMKWSHEGQRAYEALRKRCRAPMTVQNMKQYHASEPHIWHPSLSPRLMWFSEMNFLICWFTNCTDFPCGLQGVADPRICSTHPYLLSIPWGWAPSGLTDYTHIYIKPCSLKSKARTNQHIKHIPSTYQAHQHIKQYHDIYGRSPGGEGGQNRKKKLQTNARWQSIQVQFEWSLVQTWVGPSD